MIHLGLRIKMRLKGWLLLAFSHRPHESRSFEFFLHVPGSFLIFLHVCRSALLNYSIVLCRFRICFYLCCCALLNLCMYVVVPCLIYVCTCLCVVCAAVWAALTAKQNRAYFRQYRCIDACLLKALAPLIKFLCQQFPRLPMCGAHTMTQRTKVDV